MESQIHIPSLAASPSSALRSVAGVQCVASTGEDKFAYIISDEHSIPIAQQGLRVLGCPIGLDDYCSSQLDSLSRDIEHDLELLQSISYLHQRTKLAIYCCNTRPTYLLRALPLGITKPRMYRPDAVFDAFMASTLSFQRNYRQGEHKDTYAAALRQLRLGIKHGGFGLTSQALIAPAALYVALRHFASWLSKHSDPWRDLHSDIGALTWLSTHSQHEHIFPIIETLSNEALA